MEKTPPEVLDVTLGTKRYSVRSSSLAFLLTLLTIGQSYYLVYLHLKPLDHAHATMAHAIERHDQQLQRLAEAIELLAKALMQR